MGSKSIASFTFILSLNLFLFSMVAPQTPPSPSPPRECPELGLCADVLRLGQSVRPENGCCTLLGNLVQANATLCVCDIADTQLLGIDIGINLKVQLLLNLCDQQNQTIICN
ncbi:14 kDa proline-rich protein DC2.15-like [Vigna radiata var. radiata]|uniref:14 kDa proline-rich protein DC2.15-like n=1 Tax=Vigna radiata var. radiata TaxID=3916 RepID=A0A3Q0FH03_VIGRR|nr:14 kDa proline-rich protein DC2.15-like [Vigna radiata var. radiata]